MNLTSPLRKWSCVTAVAVTLVFFGYAIGTYRIYVVQHHLSKLERALVSLEPDDTGHFKYAFAEETELVLLLRRWGGVVETAERLGHLVANPDRRCRAAATLLLLDLEEGAALALPILERTASDNSSTPAIREDAVIAIELVLEKVCKRTARTAARLNRSDFASSSSG